MKRMLILLLLVIPYAVHCQYFLRIDSLMLYEIVESEPENAIIEHFGEGPFVYGYFTFYNQTEEPLCIQQSDYSMSYYYYYEEQLHSSLYLRFNIGKDSIVINARDSINLECGTSLMIDVNLRKSEKYISQGSEIINHLEIFKKILPSLYVEIIIQDSIHVASSINTWRFKHDNIDVSGKPIRIYPSNKFATKKEAIRYEE